MKNLKSIVFIVSLFSMTAAFAHSGGYYTQPGYDNHSYQNRVDRRQGNQQRRIESGIYRGRLTPREIERLSWQQNKIARIENRFKSDGWLSRRERLILQKKQNQASRRIYEFKHNDRYQPSNYGYYSYNH